MRALGRVFTILLSAAYAATNVVFAHAAEARFWEERRAAAQAASRPASSQALLAQLPATAPWSAQAPSPVRSPLFPGSAVLPVSVGRAAAAAAPFAALREFHPAAR